MRAAWADCNAKDLRCIAERPITSARRSLRMASAKALSNHFQKAEGPIPPKWLTTSAKKPLTPVLSCEKPTCLLCFSLACPLIEDSCTRASCGGDVRRKQADSDGGVNAKVLGHAVEGGDYGVDHAAVVGVRMEAVNELGGYPKLLAGG